MEINQLEIKKTILLQDYANIIKKVKIYKK